MRAENFKHGAVGQWFGSSFKTLPRNAGLIIFIKGDEPTRAVSQHVHVTWPETKRLKSLNFFFSFERERRSLTCSLTSCMHFFKKIWLIFQGKEELENHFKNSNFYCGKEGYLPVVFHPYRNGSCTFQASRLGNSMPIQRDSNTQGETTELITGCGVGLTGATK